MKAKRLSDSWEKQTFWKLENGWTATEEHSPHYGPFIKRLDSPEGKVWLASNGSPDKGLGADHYNSIFKTDKYIDLPSFASSWVNSIGLVEPKFTKVF